MLNKREFLKRLQECLTDLTSEERAEALGYYEEYFADAGEENEADVLLTLGSPEQVAERIKAGLLKAEEGMFTESGYREKMESDNPPDVYGKREGEWENTGKSGYAYQSSGQNQDGPCGGWQNRSKKRRNGQENYGYQGQQAEKRKNGMSGGMLALIIVLGIMASPIVLTIGVALLGIALGVLGCIFGLVVAGLAILVALFAVGIALFVAGFPMLIGNPVGGILCIAAGCLISALFLTYFLLIWLFFGKFFPWLIREVESFGKYLSRKWDERKQKGETI